MTEDKTASDYVEGVVLINLEVEIIDDDDEDVIDDDDDEPE